MEEAGRTDACETRREATSNSARVQWRALGEWRSEAKDATGQKGGLSAESVSAQTTPEQWGMNSEGKNRMSVKGLRAPSLALAYEDWTAPQAAGPINNSSRASSQQRINQLDRWENSEMCSSKNVWKEKEAKTRKCTKSQSRRLRLLGVMASGTDGTELSDACT